MSNDRYLNEFPDETGDKAGAGSGRSSSSQNENRESRLLLFWEGLSRAGLSDTVSRIGAQLLLVTVVLVAIWALRAFYLSAQKKPAQDQALVTSSTPVQTPIPTQELPPLPEFALSDLSASSYGEGIPRLASLHTIIPTRPRTEIVTYTVQTGDTIFGIAEKYNLKPESVLWGNNDRLFDDPHYLQPGQKLRILPSDGVLHTWIKGESLNAVAKYYGISVEDILNWAGNRLSPETIGDYANPNIKVGAKLFVPGGRREFVTWSAPLGLTRKNPGVAKILGPGFCGTITDGAVGLGSFVWPANAHWLSGFDYSPETNHRAIDIAGQLGDPIYAADNGVIVYAGWNNYGYGNVIVIDHGNGWQTLYAHLSYLGVGCGQSVYQGGVIGSFGSTGNSTGPHLHFEMMHTTYGRVNPKDFLP